MKSSQLQPPFLFLSLLCFIFIITQTSSVSTPPSTTTPTLDPDQLEALQSFNIRTSKDPCSQPSFNNATLCDSSSPYRHLITLRLTNCSDDVEVSSSALHVLSSSLQDLQFIDCPIDLHNHFPLDLASSLKSFTCIHSLQKVSGLLLSRLKNVTFLTVSDVPVAASGAYVFFGNLRKLKSITISKADLGGSLPKHWHLDLTHVDFSGNKLNGSIPGSITLIDGLKSLDLSSNELTGVMPSTFGDLLLLQNVSLASNLLSGSIPDSMKAMKSLVHIDLSSNKFNGTIPKFLSELRSLKYLNLGKNEFHGVMPFNATFINKLDVFKIGGNINLCYNHSTLSNKMRLGIAQCDKHGLPISPPPAKESPGDDDDDDTSGKENDDYNADSTAGDSNHKDGHHGPSKVVLGVAIGLSAIVFLIIFCVLISKCCR